ncbi:MAG: hypothetical protein IJS32_00570 [Kiritimatiellae bacterium]|nr:hypothetical protein [Kiritimatiellia bacterium]
MNALFRHRSFSFALRKRGRKFFAGILLGAVLGAWLFSVGFILHAADHDCSGHDCPVCAIVLQCKANLQQLGSGYAPAPLAVAAAAIVFAALRVLEGRRPVHLSPVALKVRLNL